MIPWSFIFQALVLHVKAVVNLFISVILKTVTFITSGICVLAIASNVLFAGNPGVPVRSRIL
jgi:hypothetical protein